MFCKKGVEKDQSNDVEAIVVDFQQLFIHGALIAINIEPSPDL